MNALSLAVLLSKTTWKIVSLVVLLYAIAVVTFLLRERRKNRDTNDTGSTIGSVPVPQHETKTTARPEDFRRFSELVRGTRERRNLASNEEALTHLFMERVLSLSDDTIKRAATHGPDNGGIDAIHIDHDGAQVAGCDYQAVHIVACDYVDDIDESRQPIARGRLERLVNTWIAIASSDDAKLKLNAALRGRIAALHQYWQGIENDVPHQIYVITNREHTGIDRAWIEKKMDYFTSNWYHYFELADLMTAFRLADVTSTDHHEGGRPVADA